MKENKDIDSSKVEKNSLIKVKKVLSQLGRSTAEKILLITFALRSEKTPTWAKGVLFSALLYFLTPLDAIPDFIPGAGYSDDIAVILAALASVAGSIDQEVRDKAKDKAEEWLPKTEKEEKV